MILKSQLNRVELVTRPWPAARSGGILTIVVLINALDLIDVCKTDARISRFGNYLGQTLSATLHRASRDRAGSQISDQAQSGFRGIYMCPLFPEVWKARHKASPGPLKGTVSAQKRPFKGQRRGSCWQERRRKVYPQQGVIDLLGQNQ